MLKCLAVRIYILPKEHNFNHTVSHKTFNLPDDRLWITAPFPPAHIGYNTVAAEIITSEHDIDSGFKGIFSLYRQIFYNLICIFPDVDHCASGFHAGCQKFGKFKNIVGAEDQVYKTIALF